MPASRTTLVTPRLQLRPWAGADLDAFAAMNADPEVMTYLRGPLERAASDALAARFREHWERYGFGPWAVEAPGVAGFLGYVGLLTPTFRAHFTPCVEIGWRLARPYWGCGYATEAARAVLADGFGRLALAEVVSFTVPANLRSRAVMERLGMRHSPEDDFDHPSLPEGDPLRRHVLYRLARRV
jgi:RimJ/RimL family protein N-acetyltransferase